MRIGELHMIILFFLFFTVFSMVFFTAEHAVNQALEIVNYKLKNWYRDLNPDCSSVLIQNPVCPDTKRSRDYEDRHYHMKCGDDLSVSTMRRKFDLYYTMLNLTIVYSNFIIKFEYTMVSS